ncbi:putative methyl-independent mismatch repair protein [Escherichia coli]|uniref:Putative methyl-independent mismatch repair protein n=1 Tax=Escherichia coli TaxID=562 RepID=A0A377BNW8_ECOLX|nr:putative methyl-independent mismatch repair protein [Escherichia coli]
MIGGAFLCFEGVEKCCICWRRVNIKKIRRRASSVWRKLAAQDPLKFEKDKIKGAIRTDFILSAEIVAITLGIVAEAPLLNQVLVLSGIALVVTVGVYGLVGVIVKIDDLGYWLAEKSSALMQALGKGLLIIAPWLMKALSIVGTLAMFLVGGGIVVHGIAPLHHAIEHFAGQQSAVVAMILPTVLNLILGFIIGGIVVLGVKAVAKIRGQAH